VFEVEEHFLPVDFDVDLGVLLNHVLEAVSHVLKHEAHEVQLLHLLVGTLLLVELVRSVPLEDHPLLLQLRFGEFEQQFVQAFEFVETLHGGSDVDENKFQELTIVSLLEQHSKFVAVDTVSLGQVEYFVLIVDVSLESVFVFVEFVGGVQSLVNGKVLGSLFLGQPEFSHVEHLLGHHGPDCLLDLCQLQEAIVVAVELEEYLVSPLLVAQIGAFKRNLVLQLLLVLFLYLFLVIIMFS